MSFNILFVCTGNVCRSPMAELLTRAWADPEADLAVSSAGMAALVDESVDDSSAAVLRERGVDPSAHRARQFRTAMAESADLVLTAEVGHRDKIMSQLPSAFRRTFTMKEFARLAPHATSTDRAEVVEEVAWLRGAHGPVTPELDNVPDPFRARIGRARTVADQIAATVRVTLDVLDRASRLPAQPAGPESARRPSPRPHPRTR